MRIIQGDVDVVVDVTDMVVACRAMTTIIVNGIV